MGLIVVTVDVANPATPDIRASVDLLVDSGAAPVIFGEPGDATLLGTVTLESLGLILDPIRRELRPLPMIVAVAC